jgi:hypothetical protein
MRPNLQFGRPVVMCFCFRYCYGARGRDWLVRVLFYGGLSDSRRVLQGVIYAGK